jgi:serine/threonine-protein kinase
MTPDELLERSIQALLDGRTLTTGDSAPSHVPLHIVDSIARVHRVALFGTDVLPDETAPVTWGHLTLRGELGSGADGTVYRAWDTQLEREVALKLLTTDADLDTALGEGRLLARLDHPHVVRVYGADVHDGRPGVWMELLEGETLEQMVSRDGPFSAAEALFIGIDLARALIAVHAAGLLHRDVKCRNIVRERGGRVVLMDFGAGRTTATSPKDRDDAGTPMYMAPEVLSGLGASERSDIYGAGVVLYRLLTGRYPVAATRLGELRATHAAGGRVPIAAARPALPIEVTETVDRACDADPEKRYGNAAELEAALVGALRTALESQTSGTSTASGIWRRWRTTGLASAAAVGLVLIGAALAWDTDEARGARRSAGLTVPPKGTLYLSMNGSLGVLRRGRLELMPFNPAVALTIAASEDLGVRTMTSIPPWTTGGAFRLDGTPVPPPASFTAGLCCFGDGTTDGQFNYAVRQDSTGLAPIGSRSLAPPAVYRFDREWGNPRQHFLLDAAGTYMGIAYSKATDSFFVTRTDAYGAAVEEWSVGGTRRAIPVREAGAAFQGIAVDPADDTLWLVRLIEPRFQLDNFDAVGTFLGSLIFDTYVTPGGAEFAWPSHR